jgi:hypothetical protein
MTLSHRPQLPSFVPERKNWDFFFFFFGFSRQGFSV